jgi:hypothetical protein
MDESLPCTTYRLNRESDEARKANNSVTKKANIQLRKLIIVSL